MARRCTNIHAREDETHPNVSICIYSLEHPAIACSIAVKCSMNEHMKTHNSHSITTSVIECILYLCVFFEGPARSVIALLYYDNLRYKEQTCILQSGELFPFPV